MTPAAELFCRMLRTECAVPDARSTPVFTRLMGKGPKAQFAAILRQLEAWDEAMVEDMARRYWLEIECDEPVLFPEALEVLQRLRAAGHTLIVSSGGIPASVQRKTRVTGIDRLFRLTLGSDDEIPGLEKGAGHFALIAEALALKHADLQARAVFIGDGVYDMQVAREAGIPGIGRLTGENQQALLAAGARFVIADLTELESRLHSL